MIIYEPFWDYLDWHEISTYTLITKHHVSSSTINRLRHNQPVSTATITNKPAGKCHAQNVINFESGSRPESHFFQMELMKIKTAGNHAELKKKRLYPTAARPDIRPVPLDRAKSTLGLNTSVHTEQHAVNAVQIIQNLCVKLRQLLVQTDDPVSLALAAFFLVRTAAAILALKR